MKKLVVYDSLYGNTEKVAYAVAKSLSAKTVTVKEIKIADLQGLDVLVVGSQTQGGRATIALQELLKDIPPKTLKNVKTAVFDTRFLEKELNFALKMLVKTIGYAAPKMAEVLKSKGVKLIAPPEGFIVIGKEGPLAPGELKRAREWLKL